MLTGKSYLKGEFRFFEGNQVSYERIYDVLTGRIPGCIFHNAITEGVSGAIHANFLNNSHTRCREDGVPGKYLGTYHYKKELQHYLDESSIYRPVLDNIFTGTENVFSNIMAGISSELSNHNQIARTAAYQDQLACPYFIRKWQGNNDGNFALSPHDDQSQCSLRTQRGFEIQDTAASKAVVALNLCLNNHGRAELHYWNIQPDNESKKMLGVSETGYPYPEETLEGVDKLVIPIEAGDLYFFNGKNVHAVSSPEGESSHRTTLSCLMGFKSDNETLIYWT